MKMKVDQELLDKFFNYRCTEEEERKVKAWLATMENDFKDISSIERAWFEFEPPDDNGEWGKNSIYSKIEDGINRDINRRSTVIDLHKKDKTQPPRDSKFNSYFTISNFIAAAVSLLFIVGYVLHIKDDNKVLNKTEVVEVALLTKENPKGQKTTIKLPDGTVVKLNAESSLIFPERFGKDRRLVQLKGEAFFDVKKDKSRPFIIKVGELEAKVLGTSFNINAFPESGVIDIALLTGKLAVNSQDSEAAPSVLLPTERLVFDKGTKEIQRDYFDKEKVLAWKEGLIVFEKASFKEIVYKLERWYGCSFELPKNTPLKKISYTGKFKNKSLKEVLDGLSVGTELKFLLKDKKVQLMN